MFKRDVTKSHTNKPHHVKRSKDRRVFSGTADSVHPANNVQVERGGIRL